MKIKKEMRAINYLIQARNIPQQFFDMASAFPDQVVYRFAVVNPVTDGENRPRDWRARNYSEVRSRVTAIAQFLLSLNLGSKARVAILSNTRPEWMEADVAILATDATVVALYQSLTPQDIGFILHDSQAQVVFAENQEQVDKLLKLSGQRITIPAVEDRPACEVKIDLKKIIAIETVAAHPLIVQLDQILANTRDTVNESFPGVSNLSRDDLASLVYTSGTAGPAKGVMQTHGNHLANLRQAFEGEMFKDGNSIFLFLPLAHSFAKLMGYLGFISGAEARFAGIPDKTTSKMNPGSITRDMRESGSDIVPIVPRLLEKMQSAVMAKAQGDGFQQRVLRRALAVAVRKEAAREAGRNLGLVDSLVYACTGLVRKKIATRLFGPNFKYAISGGAKLSIDVARFFAGLGIEVLEGYGLTETCVATNVNRRGRQRIGTVGPVLAKDIELKIASDGEILFRGPNIARGYLNRPKATKEAWDEQGWFHTGDTGSVDKDGYLRIEGRKKELIVTSGGKKIAPDPIEQKLKTSEYISQAILVGEGKNFCVALIVVEIETLSAWAKKQDLDLSGFHENPRVYELIMSEVNAVNSTLASFESIKRIAILPEELSIENGLLTPTLKVKRKEVTKRYDSIIQALYAH